MPSEEPVPVLEQQARILCIGQAVVDVVMSVEEMPRRPEKYRAEQAAIIGGGCAANAAVAIARLGGAAHMATRLGSDEMGGLIRAGLEADGVDSTLAKRFETGRSSFSSILVDKAGERQIVNFRDPDLPEDAAWLAEFLFTPPNPPNSINAILADTRWGPGALAGMQAARRLEVPGIMDAEAPIDVAREALEAASHIVFSAQGLAEFSGSEDLAAGLASATEAFQGFVAVTDGPQGVSWLQDGVLMNLPAFPVAVVDTLGAGDVWHGAFALALGEGQEIHSALRFSNAAASLKCTKQGGRAGAPTREEVEAFLAPV